MCSNVSLHIRTHTCDKPCKFNICGEGFSDNNSLQAHIKAHTGDKPNQHDLHDKCDKEIGNSH
jgi:KRAB domain-containing zinc finger protein